MWSRERIPGQKPYPAPAQRGGSAYSGCLLRRRRYRGSSAIRTGFRSRVVPGALGPGSRPPPVAERPTLVGGVHDPPRGCAGGEGSTLARHRRSRARAHPARRAARTLSRRARLHALPAPESAAAKPCLVIAGWVSRAQPRNHDEDPGRHGRESRAPGAFPDPLLELRWSRSGLCLRCASRPPDFG